MNAKTLLKRIRNNRKSEVAPEKPTIKVEPQYLMLRERIDSKGVQLIDELKETDSMIEKIRNSDFVTESSEKLYRNLLLKKITLRAQIKLLGWILDVKQ
jgi:hypothetical protein